MGSTKTSHNNGWIHFHGWLLGLLCYWPRYRQRPFGCDCPLALGVLSNEGPMVGTLVAGVRALGRSLIDINVWPPLTLFLRSILLVTRKSIKVQVPPHNISVPSQWPDVCNKRLINVALINLITRTWPRVNSKEVGNIKWWDFCLTKITVFIVFLHDSAKALDWKRRTTLEKTWLKH